MNKTLKLVFEKLRCDAAPTAHAHVDGDIHAQERHAERWRLVSSHNWSDTRPWIPALDHHCCTGGEWWHTWSTERGENGLNAGVLFKMPGEPRLHRVAAARLHVLPWKLQYLCFVAVPRANALQFNASASANGRSSGALVFSSGSSQCAFVHEATDAIGVEHRFRRLEPQHRPCGTGAVAFGAPAAPHVHHAACQCGCSGGARRHAPHTLRTVGELDHVQGIPRAAAHGQPGLG